MSKKLDLILKLLEKLENVALKLKRDPNMALSEFNYYCRVMETLNNELALLIEQLQK